jgi:hypothetical protein
MSGILHTWDTKEKRAVQKLEGMAPSGLPVPQVRALMPLVNHPVATTAMYVAVQLCEQPPVYSALLLVHKQHRCWLLAGIRLAQVILGTHMIHAHKSPCLH